MCNLYKECVPQMCFTNGMHRLSLSERQLSMVALSLWWRDGSSSIVCICTVLLYRRCVYPSLPVRMLYACWFLFCIHFATELGKKCLESLHFPSNPYYGMLDWMTPMLSLAGDYIVLSLKFISGTSTTPFPHFLYDHAFWSSERQIWFGKHYNYVSIICPPVEEIVHNTHPVPLRYTWQAENNIASDDEDETQDGMTPFLDDNDAGADDIVGAWGDE